MMLETLAELRRQFERRHPEWFDPANYAEALPRELAANQRQLDRMMELANKVRNKGSGDER